MILRLKKCNTSDEILFATMDSKEEYNQILNYIKQDNYEETWEIISNYDQYFINFKDLDVSCWRLDTFYKLLFLTNCVFTDFDIEPVIYYLYTEKDLKHFKLFTNTIYFSDNAINFTLHMEEYKNLNEILVQLFINPNIEIDWGSVDEYEFLESAGEKFPQYYTQIRAKIFEDYDFKDLQYGNVTDCEKFAQLIKYFARESDADFIRELIVLHSEPRYTNYATIYALANLVTSLKYPIEDLTVYEKNALIRILYVISEDICQRYHS